MGTHPVIGWSVLLVQRVVHTDQCTYHIDLWNIYQLYVQVQTLVLTKELQFSVNKKWPHVHSCGNTCLFISCLSTCINSKKAQGRENVCRRMFIVDIHIRFEFNPIFGILIDNPFNKKSKKSWSVAVFTANFKEQLNIVDCLGPLTLLEMR